MSLPEPKPKESEKEFVSRCIPAIHDTEKDKYNDKQIVAMCYSQFERSKKKESIKEKMGSIKDLNEQEIFYTDKGLTPEEARKRTIGKVKQDHRGFTYCQKTGKCVYT